MPKLVLPKTASTGKPAHTRTAVGNPPEHSDVGSVLLTAVIDRFRLVTKRLAKSRRNPSEKSIHDLRVALRRTMAALDIVRTVLPGSGIAKTRKEMKKHLNALSSLRDVQVQIRTIRELADMFPFVRLFLPSLLRQEKELVSKAIQGIAEFPLASMEKAMTRVETDLGNLFSTGNMLQTTHLMLLGSIGQAFTKASIRKAEAMSGDSKKIHRLRLAFKRYRYLVEMLAPILPDVSAQTLQAMNTYQVHLGEIQDVENMIKRMAPAVFRRYRIPPEQSVLLQQHLAHRRTQLVNGFLSSADDLDAFWCNPL